MECSRCLLTSDVVNIKDGYCDYCRLHDELEKNKPEEFEKILVKIRKRKGHQVLIGISGGFDSSYLLWYTVKVLKLKPLVFHFDNKWNTDIAEHNMATLISKLNVDLVRITSDDEYDELCGALLAAGVKDLDIANDMYMAEMMQSIARRYNIKYIFNGHDFRTEGSTPLGWTYMDAKYIRSVFKWAYGRKLKAPVQTFWKQIFSGVKQIRVFHYLDIPIGNKVETLFDFGLKSYGLKHGENDYTVFIGYYILPKYWNIDKRIVYLSAQVRSGYLTKKQAKIQLKEIPYEPVPGADDIFYKVSYRTGFPIGKYEPTRHYHDFKHYNFKKFKFLIKILSKLKLVPYTFYKKYT